MVTIHIVNGIIVDHTPSLTQDAMAHLRTAWSLLRGWEQPVTITFIFGNVRLEEILSVPGSCHVLPLEEAQRR